jgi:hypothetical protein
VGLARALSRAIAGTSEGRGQSQTERRGGEVTGATGRERPSPERERERDPADSLTREREHRGRQRGGGVIRTGRELRERDGEWGEL